MMNHVISAVCLGLLLSTAVTVTATGQQHVCQLSPVTGLCRASIPRFYYNEAAGQCQQFTYGGCGGNDNRFRTLQQCKRVCSNLVCNLPKVTGTCRAYMPSYFYNPDNRRCESFIYTGCGGNANRFSSQRDCEEVCSKLRVCQQPKVVGMCRAAFPRWHYDAAAGSCREFTYGGCGGNANNFKTQLECKQKCLGGGQSQQQPQSSFVGKWRL